MRGAGNGCTELWEILFLPIQVDCGIKIGSDPLCVLKSVHVYIYKKVLQDDTKLWT